MTPILPDRSGQVNVAVILLYGPHWTRRSGRRRSARGPARTCASRRR